MSFCHFKIVGWVRFSVICQCLTFLFPHFGVSAWLLECTKHMGRNSDVVQWRIYVRTENRWAKEIRAEGVIQEVLEIVMNLHVMYKKWN